MNPTALFKAALEASWQGSLVILLILLVRPWLGLRVPALWRYLLWGLVLVRLLVPAFVMPPSPASLQNFAVVDRPLEEAGWALPAEARPNTRDRWQNQGPAAGEAISAAASRPPAPELKSWWKMAALVWLAGAGIAGLWMLSAIVLLQWRLSRDGRELDEKVQGIWRRCGERASLRRLPAAGHWLRGIARADRSLSPRAPASS